ncbi:VOC family protein [Micromonospora echinofusca]|uniref:VOC family protein n=1 Tax=Micromonospora echinofusca TaxID=47858 RepID=A0ABS3VTL7_MICEH|nr:VOC family protein [Micromonospora echinofusca]MBO4207708.1 VOC family protein [Micromonospora echinofusca]
MTSHIRTITVDCADPYTLARWWSAVLDRRLGDDDHPGDPEVILLAPDGAGTDVLFIQVPEGKIGEPRTGHHRFHLDLMPTDQTRDVEVERLVGLGATLVGDHRKPDGTGWVVLADPEGNEFCVERSPAERASAI